MFYASVAVLPQLRFACAMRVLRGGYEGACPLVVLLFGFAYRYYECGGAERHFCCVFVLCGFWDRFILLCVVLCVCLGWLLGLFVVFCVVVV